MQMGKVFTDAVVVGKRHRALDTDKVTDLAASMAALGLQQPISVVEDDEGVVTLVAGLHRLRAAQQLGWESIDAVFVDMDDVKREMWEIAENLHRADLTVIERGEHIARWLELEKLRQPDAVSSGGRGNKGGRRGAAREIGVSEPDARRAEKVASLSDEAKQAARDTGLDDNRTALLDAARGKTPTEQVAILNKRAEPAQDPAIIRAKRRRTAMNAWNKLDQEDREWFRDWIDDPVFDRTRTGTAA